MPLFSNSLALIATSKSPAPASGDSAVNVPVLDKAAPKPPPLPKTFSSAWVETPNNEVLRIRNVPLLAAAVGLLPSQSNEANGIAPGVISVTFCPDVISPVRVLGDPLNVWAWMPWPIPLNSAAPTRN